MVGFDVVCCHLRASTVGACGIERLDGEWLVLMLCAATDMVSVGTCGIECLDGSGWF